MENFEFYWRKKNHTFLSSHLNNHRRDRYYWRKKIKSRIGKRTKTKLFPKHCIRVLFNHFQYRKNHSFDHRTKIAYFLTKYMEHLVKLTARLSSSLLYWTFDNQIKYTFFPFFLQIDFCWIYNLQFGLSKFHERWNFWSRKEEFFFLFWKLVQCTQRNKIEFKSFFCTTPTKLHITEGVYFR